MDIWINNLEIGRVMETTEKGVEGAHGWDTAKVGLSDLYETRSAHGWDTAKVGVRDLYETLGGAFLDSGRCLWKIKHHLR